jgi:hypothetical protein
MNGLPVSQASALDYLEATAHEALASGFGRRHRAVATLPTRGGVLEVVRMRDGGRIIAQDIRAEFKPPTDKLWQPVEYIASVGPAGLVAPLTITVRSGVDEVDMFFRNYLAQTFRVGDVLAPGFYRIIVAP